MKQHCIKLIMAFIVWIIFSFMISGCARQPAPNPGTLVTPFNGATASVTSTISPTKPPTVTVTATSTLVPAGVFALKFYPPLIMNYDFSVWKDESQYDNNSMMVNFLQAQNLSTCMIGPIGPSGHFPSPDAIIMLGKIHYEFSSMQSSVDGMMIGVYIVDSSVDPSQTLPGYDSIHGLPKLNVIASALEWEQCKDLAEGVLATLHSSTPPFISVPTETVVPASTTTQTETLPIPASPTITPTRVPKTPTITPVIPTHYPMPTGLPTSFTDQRENIASISREEAENYSREELLKVMVSRWLEGWKANTSSPNAIEDYYMGDVSIRSHSAEPDADIIAWVHFSIKPISIPNDWAAWPGEIKENDPWWHLYQTFGVVRKGDIFWLSLLIGWGT